MKKLFTKILATVLLLSTVISAEVQAGFFHDIQEKTGKILRKLTPSQVKKALNINLHQQVTDPKNFAILSTISKKLSNAENNIINLVSVLHLSRIILLSKATVKDNEVRLVKSINFSINTLDAIFNPLEHISVINTGLIGYLSTMAKDNEVFKKLTNTKHVLQLSTYLAGYLTALTTCIAIHELGHKTVGNYFFPNSHKIAKVTPFAGRTDFYHEGEISSLNGRLKYILSIVAGPISGFCFSKLLCKILKTYTVTSNNSHFSFLKHGFSLGANQSIENNISSLTPKFMLWPPNDGNQIVLILLKELFTTISEKLKKRKSENLGPIFIS